MIQSIQEVWLENPLVTELSLEGIVMHGEREFLVMTDGDSAHFGGVLSHEKIPEIGSEFKGHENLECSRLIIKPDDCDQHLFRVTAEYKEKTKT